MSDRNSTPIVVRSKELALEIIKLCRKLRDEKREYSLADQMLRSGTSVGANVKEAIRGISDKDMYNKFAISLKEASETEYWLEFVSESGFLTKEEIDKAYKLCQECLKLLITILKHKI